MVDAIMESDKKHNFNERYWVGKFLVYINWLERVKIYTNKHNDILSKILIEQRVFSYKF